MKKTVKIILIALVVITVFFIFSWSLPSIDSSKSESESLLEFLKPFLRKFLPDNLITDHYIRKAAHLFEYTVLGVVVTILFIYLDKIKKFSYALLIFFFTALTDETIQIFSQRGSQVQDVWIDILGTVVGTLLTFLVYFIIVRVREAKATKEVKEE